MASLDELGASNPVGPAWRHLLESILPRLVGGVVSDEQWRELGAGLDVSPEKLAELSAHVSEQTAHLVELASTQPAHLRHVKTKNGVDIFQGAEEGSPINLIKGVTRFQLPAADADAITKIARLMRNVNCDAKLAADFAQCDPMNIDSRILARTEGDFADLSQPAMVVCYGAFKTPPVVWSRDFTWAQQYSLHPAAGDQPARAVLTAGSCDVGLPDLANSHKLVRGEIISTGYVFSQVSDTEVECAYVVQVDPKGLLPIWVVNLVAADQADNAGRMRERVAGYLAADGLFEAAGAVPGEETFDLFVKPRKAADLQVAAPADAPATVSFALHTPNGALGVAVQGADCEWSEWARHETGDAPLTGSFTVPAGTTATLKLDNGFSFRTSKHVFIRLSRS